MLLSCFNQGTKIAFLSRNPLSFAAKLTPAAASGDPNKKAAPSNTPGTANNYDIKNKLEIRMWEEWKAT